MRLAFSIRTADRAPDKNYVGATVRALLKQGVDPMRVHVCATKPDPAWLLSELQASPVQVHFPARRLTPNENGLAQIRAVAPDACDWLVLLEDDLGFCADFEGSAQRWLIRFARPDRHVYRFFGFNLQPNGTAAYDWPLAGLRGSQAVVLRMADALDFAAWGETHLTDWIALASPERRPSDPSHSFDKFLATWALQRWPKQPGVMSHPLFVRHVGAHSTIHARAAHNDALFAGAKWSFA
jgi:hypothetical protein